MWWASWAAVDAAVPIALEDACAELIAGEQALSRSVMLSL